MAEKKQALDGRRVNAFGMDPDDIYIIGRDTEDGPEHSLWRKTANDPPDPIKLASIKELGIVQSVAVMKVEAKIKGKTVVVAAVAAGRGRVIAARELKHNHGWDGDVPCVYLKGDEVVQASVAATENGVRRAPDVLEQADDAVRFSNMGLDHGRIAARIGVTKPRVKELLKLVETAPQVRKMVAAGEMSLSAAADLSELTREKQVEAVDEIKAKVAEGGGRAASSVRETRKVVAQKAGKEMEHALTSKELKVALAACEALCDKGGAEDRLRARGIRDGLLIALGRKPKIKCEVTEAIGGAK